MSGEPPAVLIVDDDPAIREVIATIIHQLREDIPVILASDCMQAIDKVGRRRWRRKKVRPLVSLIDARLPLMDGFKCAETLSDKGIKNIVIMSSFLDPDLVPKAVSAGADTVFKKSLGPRQLALALVAMVEALETESSLGHAEKR